MDNVKTIRSGINIPLDGKFEADPEIVKIAELILAGAKSGWIRELGYVYCTPDLHEKSFGYRGEEYNFTLFYSMAQALASSYFENVVMPSLTGIYPEVDEDE